MESGEHPEAFILDSYWGKGRTTIPTARYSSPLCVSSIKGFHPLQNITQAQRDRFGEGNPKHLLEWYSFVLLAICFMKAQAAHLFRSKYRYGSFAEGLLHTGNGTRHVIAEHAVGGSSFANWAMVYWFGIIGTCVGVNLACYAHVLQLSTFVHGSG